MRLAPRSALPILLAVGGQGVVALWHAILMLGATTTCWSLATPVAPMAVHFGLLRTSPVCHAGTFLLGDLALWLLGGILALSVSTLLASLGLIVVLLGGITAARRAVRAMADWFRRRLVSIAPAPWLGTRTDRSIPRIAIVVTSEVVHVLRRRGPPALLLTGP